MRNARLRGEERAARVDLVHQVISLHLRGERPGQLDRRRVVHADVDSAECLNGGLDRLNDARFVPHVDDERERLAARCFDLFRSGENGSGQMLVRLRGLRCDRDVGAVACGAQRNCEADPPARAGDEQGLARQVFRSGLCHEATLEKSGARFSANAANASFASDDFSCAAKWTPSSSIRAASAAGSRISDFVICAAEAGRAATASAAARAFARSSARGNAALAMTYRLGCRIEMLTEVSRQRCAVRRLDPGEPWACRVTE